MTFGQKLKLLMEEHNLTQRKLAQELSIASSTLNGYVNDHREPDFKTLAQLAGYFHVSSDYLLGIPPTVQLVDISTDPGAQRLFHYYQRLDPELKALLIDQAKLLTKYNPASKEASGQN